MRYFRPCSVIRGIKPEIAQQIYRLRTMTTGMIVFLFLTTIYLIFFLIIYNLFAVL
jgi:hypothetical protein